ncbi:membrane protein [Corynebacterium minutissimum]|uniref:Membrane protein n=1 Tax=Corynebacterium minutissimum TaxID=38301 RepID=A0ACC4UC62_9CORY|nr:membrane protein [Corynebacterium minutissimum]
MTTSLATRAALGAWGIALVLAVCWPFVLPGEFLWRDMVLIDNPALSASAFGAGDLPARNAPQDGVLALFGGAWLARVFILAAASASAWVAGRWACQRTQFSPWAAAAAMACAVANPFVIERLLQGQWSLAVAAWLAPVIAWGCLAAHPRVAWLALWAASLTPTGGLFGGLIAVVCDREGRRRWLFAGGSVLLWLPWLVPSLAAGSPTTPGDPAAQAAAFAPRAEAYVGAVGSLLGFGGIWNAAAVPASREQGFALAGLAVAALAILGATRLPRRELRPLAILAVLGMGLAIFGALAPGLTAFAVEHIPGAGLVRDSSKLTLLALPLAVAGIASLRQLPAALALCACLLQAPDAPRELAVLRPRETGIDRKLVEDLDGRLTFFADRPAMVPLDGGIALDPYSKAANKLDSGELTVDGVTVDEPSPRYLAAAEAWTNRDLDRLEELGVGAVVEAGSIVATTNAQPAPAPWALSAAWCALPLLATLRSARRFSPTKK